MERVPRLKVTVRNATKKEAIIDIIGEIGWVNDSGEWNTASAIKDQLDAISEIETEKIIVNISSPGGYVDDGLTIHDALANHPAQVETIVTGMTASAATIIAQAGDVRKMSKNALYLVHKSWNMVVGNENDLITALDDARAVDKNIANLYARRSGRSEAFYTNLMNEKEGRGSWLDSETALQYGLIDEEVEPMGNKAAASVDITGFKAYMPELPKAEEIKRPENEITVHVNVTGLEVEAEEPDEEELQDEGDTSDEGCISNYKLKLKLQEMSL
jgi:ATP-dependent protease ClpP protease subunit